MEAVLRSDRGDRRVFRVRFKQSALAKIQPLESEVGLGRNRKTLAERILDAPPTDLQSAADIWHADFVAGLSRFVEHPVNQARILSIGKFDRVGQFNGVRQGGDNVCESYVAALLCIRLNQESFPKGKQLLQSFRSDFDEMSLT